MPRGQVQMIKARKKKLKENPVDKTRRSTHGAWSGWCTNLRNGKVSDASYAIVRAENKPAIRQPKIRLSFFVQESISRRGAFS